jgi:hypothetical protein
MKKLIGSLGTAALLVAATALANDASALDVGLINHLSGDVRYTSGSTTDKAKPYMKVREGDKLTVAAGAQLRIVYFQGGRQETYSGPAALTAGTQQSTQQSGAQPQVATLPSGVPQKISQTPDLIQIARLGRSGGVAVRGAQDMKRMTAQEQAEVRAAREVYTQLRQSTPADDITPELYLYSVLQDHRLYNDMKTVVSEMQRRQPSNPDVGLMVDYVKVKTEQR